MVNKLSIKNLFLVLFILVLVSSRLFSSQYFYSKTDQKNISYNVYLPKGYNNNRNNPFPVIFLLHPLNDNENSWQNKTKGNLKSILDSLIERHIIKPIVVIMPYGENSWYIDSINKVYTSYTQDFFPYIFDSYNVDKNRNNVAIAGASMGGSGALTIFLKSPQIFGKVMLLSPALVKSLPKKSLYRFNLTNQDLEDNYYTKLWDYYSNSNFKSKISIIIGGDESKSYHKNSKHLSFLFKNRGDSVVFKLVKGGHHNWATWRTAFKKEVIQMFGEQS